MQLSIHLRNPFCDGLDVIVRNRMVRVAINGFGRIGRLVFARGVGLA